MPTDLDEIEARLRSTLASVAEQTVVDEQPAPADVLAIHTANGGRARYRVAAVAVAAVLLLVVGFVVATRGDETAQVSTEPSPPPVPLALELTYRPTYGRTSPVDPVRTPVGQPVSEMSADRQHFFAVRSTPTPFDAGTEANVSDRFDGADGLTFAVTRDDQHDLQLRELEFTLYQVQYQLSLYSLAGTASAVPFDTSQSLDQLHRREADLQQQIDQFPFADIVGGRGDLRVALFGDDLTELRRIALGLRVVSGSTVSTAPPPAPPTTSTTAPSSGTATPSPTWQNIPHVTPPPFTAPLPAGVQLFVGYYSKGGSPPVPPLSLDWLIRPPSDAADYSFTYTFSHIGAADPDVATMTQWPSPPAGRVNVDPPRTPETTPFGLQLVDLGDTCEPSAATIVPTTIAPLEPNPRCGHTIAMWSDRGALVLVVYDPSIDALAWARSFRPT
jgi:hypothetical protein